MRQVQWDDLLGRVPNVEVVYTGPGLRRVALWPIKAFSNKPPSQLVFLAIPAR